jgi:hypothetical protein
MIAWGFATLVPDENIRRNHCRAFALWRNETRLLSLTSVLHVNSGTSQTKRPPEGGLSVPSDAGKSSYHALLGVCEMNSLGLALLVAGMAFLVSGLIFLIPTERKLSSSQETIEESLERLGHHLDEMRRERGEL